MYKISVIIPCYNAETYLSECLNSVLQQTHQHFEIICVDDGSSDRTLEILNQFKEKHAGKISVISKPNGGASAARNLGLKAAQGDIIQFLDADDLITSNKFEKQLEGFSENVDVVVSDRIYKNHDLTETLETYYFNDIQENPLETAVKKIIITCNPLYRIQVVKALNGYDEHLKSAQDWDFHLRMVLTGYRIQYIPGIYLINRKVKDSVSSNWVKVSIQAANVAKKLRKQLLENTWMTESVKQYLAQLYMNTAIYCKDENVYHSAVEELEFWAQGNYAFVRNRLKRISIRFLGIKTVIRLLKKQKRRELQ